VIVDDDRLGDLADLGPDRALAGSTTVIDVSIHAISSVVWS
jgi:hypothetical protein